MDSELIIDSLRAEGYRITKARENIIRVLCNGGHFGIEDIIKKLSEQGEVNIATVYNNINFLVDERVVNEFAFNGKHSVYELNIGLHAHLICNVCGEIANVGIPGLAHIKDIVEENTGFVVEDNKLDFYGLCKKCKDKQK